jgi:hypothetical protein
MGPCAHEGTRVRPPYGSACRFWFLEGPLGPVRNCTQIHIYVTLGRSFVCLCEAAWVPQALGPTLDPYGSKYGPILGPIWIHCGSYMATTWAHLPPHHNTHCYKGTCVVFFPITTRFLYMNHLRRWKETLMLENTYMVHSTVIQIVLRDTIKVSAFARNTPWKRRHCHLHIHVVLEAFDLHR